MADRPPLVSVFTAAHDIGSRIDATYQSLRNQSYLCWEWVVADDSQGPATGDHLAMLSERVTPGQIRVCKVSGSGSIGAAKALAAGACRGEILVELDHDDELRPNALEIIVAALLAKPEVDFVYSDWIDWSDSAGGGSPAVYPTPWGLGFGAYASEVIDGRRVPVALAPPLTWETVRHIVATPNHVRAWRSNFYRQIGGHDPRLPVADDYELVLRTFLNGTTARIPRPLYVQHHDPRGSNASRRRNAEIQQRVQEIAERNGDAIDRRCLSLGIVPSAPSPLTGWQPLCTATTTLDPVADADTHRDKPLVSVVMPTYGRPHALQRALASALGQSYDNFEVLVVGDSCPSVDDVIEATGDHRVRHWNLPSHTGDSGAGPRNYALKTMARGALVAYLDDDNTWEADHLESLVDRLLSNPRLGFAFASLKIGNDTIICRRPRRMQIDTSALLHRRSLLDRFGYWRGPRERGWGYAHDWELVSRWESVPWVASLQPTVRYTLRQSAQSEQTLAAIKDVGEQERRSGSAHVGVASATSRRPSVAVYTIARNEEGHLERWARSARDADHLIIVDTGSSDGTVRRARELGVQAHEIHVEPFRYDVARNEALDRLPADIDMCVSLDADEVLVPGWRTELEKHWRQGATRIRCTMRWRWSDQHPPLRHTVYRIHARHGYCWECPVHEQLVALGPEVSAHARIEIHHLRDSSRSVAGNLELLRVAVVECPSDGRMVHMLANEARLNGLQEEAISCFHRALALELPRNERMHSMLTLSHLEPARREKWVTLACAESPERREPWFELAQLQLARGRWRDARAAAERALAITEPADDYLANPHAWGPLPEEIAERASRELRIPDRGPRDDGRGPTVSPMIDFVSVTFEDRAAADRMAEQLRQTVTVPYTFTPIDNTSRNVGWAAACNEGARDGESELIAFIDQDVELSDGWLDPVLQALEADPGLVITGPRCLDGLPWPRVPDGLDQWVCGACLLVRRDFFESVGGFDADSFPHEYAETDLERVASARELRVRTIEQSHVVHHLEHSKSPQVLAWRAHGARNQTRKWGIRLDPWGVAHETTGSAADDDSQPVPWGQP